MFYKFPLLLLVLKGKGWTSNEKKATAGVFCSTLSHRVGALQISIIVISIKGERVNKQRKKSTEGVLCSTLSHRVGALQIFIIVISIKGERVNRQQQQQKSPLKSYCGSYLYSSWPQHPVDGRMSTTLFRSILFIILWRRHFTEQKSASSSLNSFFLRTWGYSIFSLGTKLLAKSSSGILCSSAKSLRALSRRVPFASIACSSSELRASTFRRTSTKPHSIGLTLARKSGWISFRNSSWSVNKTVSAKTKKKESNLVFYAQSTVNQ